MYISRLVSNDTYNYTYVDFMTSKARHVKNANKCFFDTTTTAFITHALYISYTAMHKAALKLEGSHVP